MKRKHLIIAGLVIAALAAGLFAYIRFMNDPDRVVKRTAVEIVEDSPQEISFSFGKRDDVKRLQAFYFIPEESGDYRFSVTGIVNDSTASMGLYVANETFEEYFVLDNYSAEETEGVPEDLEGESFLEKGQKCYIMTVVIGSEETGEFEGSANVNVSRRIEEELEEVKANDSVILDVKDEGQNCALFRPEESSYYKFDTTIVTADASQGFSSVSSVSSDDDLKIPVTEGVVWLDAGKDYHVWAEVSEAGGGVSEVVLSCRKMNTQQASGTCELDLDNETLVEYLAENNGYLAVYSVSEGDPAGLIYETPGFPLRSDDNNAQRLFSKNKKDFAMVFKAEAGKTYSIAVHRDFRNCKVVIEPYEMEEEQSEEDEDPAEEDEGQMEEDESDESDSGEEAAE